MVWFCVRKVDVSVCEELLFPKLFMVPLLIDMLINFSIEFFLLNNTN